MFKYNFLKKILHSGVFRYIPFNPIRHYFYPLTVTKKKKIYNPDQYWNSRYKLNTESEFSDRSTIAIDHNLLHSFYHYNVTENSLIKVFGRYPVKKNPRVLDIGSGAGHWVKFYLEVFEAFEVVGVDISEYSVNALKDVLKDKENVTILQKNVSVNEFAIDGQFDIINAIGVIFHIVDDLLWETALRNFKQCLSKNGYLVVGGQFGFITQYVQFHNVDQFSSWDEYYQDEKKEVLINKRIRSIFKWRKTLDRVGLKVVTMQKTEQSRGIIMPENNILVITHK